MTVPNPVLAVAGVVVLGLAFVAWKQWRYNRLLNQEIRRDSVHRLQAGKDLNWRKAFAKANPDKAQYLTHMEPDDPFWGGEPYYGGKKDSDE